MTDRSKTIELKINKPIGGKKVGEIVQLKVDQQGNIRDIYWARRLQEAKLDNCVELVEEVKTADFYTETTKKSNVKKSEKKK